MLILGRGGAGKSALSRQLSDVTGIPAVELDALFWQPGPTPMDPSRWAACQQELVQRDRWILDGDLGPYDTALEVRLRAADTIVVLDFPSCDAPGGPCAEAMSRRNTGAGCGLTGVAASRTSCAPSAAERPTRNSTS